MSPLTANVDPRPLALVRIAVGFAALLLGCEVWMILGRWLTPQMLRLPYTQFIAELPASWLNVFMGVWLALSLALMAGLATKLAGILLSCQIGYVLWLDKQLYSNHLTLVWLQTMYLVLADSAARYSVESLFAGGRGDVPRWPVTVMKTQISVVYFFSGITKLNPLFLSGSVLALYWGTDGWVPVPQFFRTPNILIILAVSTVAIEIYIALALWSQRYRRPALILGISLHSGMLLFISTTQTFGILIFAVAMLAPYILFFEWDDLRHRRPDFRNLQ